MLDTKVHDCHSVGQSVPVRTGRDKIASPLHCTNGLIIIVIILIIALIVIAIIAVIVIVIVIVIIRLRSLCSLRYTNSLVVIIIRLLCPLHCTVLQYYSRVSRNSTFSEIKLAMHQPKDRKWF